LHIEIVHDQIVPHPKLSTSQNASAGQQVVNGTQAHAYAQQFIGLHLKEIGQGHPYSYWSGLARSTKDPAVAAKDQAIADTLFKGDTLQSMLNTAWTFWTIGQIAFIAFWVLLGAGIVVLGTLIFEVIEAVRGTESLQTLVVRAPEAGGKQALTAEPAAVN
jgi:hypothetical protein